MPCSVLYTLLACVNYSCWLKTLTSLERPQVDGRGRHDVRTFYPRTTDSVAMTVVPKRAYTLEFKLGVVEWVESNQQSYRSAARQFGLDRKIIRTWVGQKASLISALTTLGPQRKKMRRGEGCGSARMMALWVRAVVAPG